MADLILHQYEMSPFSEKIRRILAHKGLAFRSVRAPAVMPKPDLVALTGGYRKIPVLQIGNHVYCDTALIARVLESLAPQRTLYPNLATEIIAEWADSTLFEVAAAVAMRPTRFDDALLYLAPNELSQMAEDRAAMHADARRKFPPFAAAKTQLGGYLRRLDALLADQDFMSGSALSIADFSVVHSIWFLDRLAPEHLVPVGNVRAFLQRITAPPVQEGVPLTGEDALRVAREASPEDPAFGASGDADGLTRGQRVAVRALDYGRDPVEGDLVLLTAGEVAVRRHDERAGVVFVHFPRIGYEIKALTGTSIRL